MFGRVRSLDGNTCAQVYVHLSLDPCGSNGNREDATTDPLFLRQAGCPKIMVSDNAKTLVKASSGPKHPCRHPRSVGSPYFSNQNTAEDGIRELKYHYRRNMTAEDTQSSYGTDGYYSQVRSSAPQHP
jgi:hypothetical protein